MRTVPSLLALSALLLAAGCGSGGTAAPASLSAPAAAAGSDLVTNEQRTMALISCMEEAGWDPEFDPRDQSMSMEFPTEQEAQAEADRVACETDLGLDTPVELDDEQLSALYAQEVASAECLRAEGVDVPEAPSEEVWRGSRTSESAWDPYMALSQRGEEEYYRLLEACPREPGTT